MSGGKEQGKVGTEGIVSYIGKIKRQVLAIHPVYPWLCYYAENTGAVILFDYAKKWQLRSYSLPPETKGSPINQIIFFDVHTASNPELTAKTGVRDNETLLKDKPAHLAIVQDAAILLCSYYTESIKLIKADAEVKSFMCAGILDEAKLLFGCSTGSIFALDLAQMLFSKIIDKDPASKGIVCVKAKKYEKLARLISVSENGKVCLYEAKPLDWAFALYKEMNENCAVLSCDISENLENIVLLESTRQIVLLNMLNEGKRLAEKFPHSHINRIKIITKQPLLLCYSYTNPLILVGNINELTKEPAKFSLDWKEINPGMAKLLSLEVHPLKPEIWFMSSPERIVSVDVSPYFLPKTFVHPQFQNVVDQKEVKSELEVREDYNAKESHFFFIISGKDICCNTFTIVQAKDRLDEPYKLTNSLQKTGIVPEGISTFATVDISADGKFISLKCEKTGNAGILSVRGERPNFTLEKTFGEPAQSVAWSMNEAFCAVLNFDTKTGKSKVKICSGKVGVLELLHELQVKDVKKLYGGHLIGASDGQKCMFYHWDKFAPANPSSVFPHPNAIVWVNAQYFCAIYSSTIDYYEISEGKFDIKQISSVSCSGIIREAELKAGFLYYCTQDDLFCFIPQIQQNYLIASKAELAADFSTMVNTVKIPESVKSYKHIIHCEVSRLPATSARLIDIIGNAMVFSTLEDVLTVIKLRNTMVRFCRSFLLGYFAAATKSINKMKMEDLYYAWKFMLKIAKKIPESIIGSIAKLPIEYQVDLGTLKFERILEEVKRGNVSIQVLTKLCYDFAVKDSQEAICDLINALVGIEKYKEAYQLVDYVKHPKHKSVILFNCKHYGEAYLFAQAAKDEALQAKILGMMKQELS